MVSKQQLKQKKARKSKIAKLKRVLDKKETKLDEALELALTDQRKLHEKLPPLTVNEWTKYLQAGMSPAFNYMKGRPYFYFILFYFLFFIFSFSFSFLDHFFVENDLMDSRFSAFKLGRSARIFNPVYAKSKNVSDILELADGLKLVPQLRTKLPEVKRELIQYHAQLQIATFEKNEYDFCMAGKDNEGILKWHYRKKSERPNMYEFVKILSLIQPTSAASERAFSVLTDMFPKARFRSKADLVETSVQLRVHKRSL